MELQARADTLTHTHTQQSEPTVLLFWYVTVV